MSQQKLNDVLDLHYKATGERKRPSDVRARGTTFEKIAFSADGGYARYIDRATKKINAKRNEEKDIEGDMKLISKAFRESYDLLISRNKKYGDSWKVMSVQAIASLCEMKLNRIAQLGELEAKTFDEIQDVFNYMCFCMVKLYSLNKRRDEPTFN